MLGVKSTILASQSDIAGLNKRYKQEHATVHQIVTALRRPETIIWISHLPAVAKLARWGESLIPAFWWERFRQAVLASGANKHHKSSASPEKPILPLSKDQIDFFRARTRVRIDKAKRLLGYEPSFDLEQGMKLTEMWVKYSNLV